MNDSTKSPPAWIRTFFYLLIIIVLLICVATFILRASCLFSDPSSQSVGLFIVTFGAGLSLICGILWIGGVTNTIVLSRGTQNALWVTLIAAVLSITVTVYKGFFNTSRMYQLTGVIEKQDGADPRDVEITTCFPPLFPIPSTEENLAINVWEESDGKLPKLSIAQPAYIRKSIDLNDSTLVRRDNNTLHIIEPIVLIPNPK